MTIKGIVLDTKWLEWTEEDKKRLSSIANGAELKFEALSNLTERDFLETDFLLGNPMMEDILKFKKLCWLQLQSAGADAYTKSADFPKEVLLTNATGTYGLTISEHLLATTLMLQRKLHLYLKNQEAELWQGEGDIQSIDGSTVLVAGLGDIGTEFARRVKALGAHVIGIKRKIYGDETDIDEVYTSEKLPELLPRADIVASSLPSTPETYKIFDAAAFEKMKSNAVFLNVGRGNAVDLEALIIALNSEKIAGAALDVVDPEPLPKGHPAWQTKNLIITPHIAGGYTLSGTKERFINIFASNLKAFVNKQALKNVVDFKTGYRKK